MMTGLKAYAQLHVLWYLNGHAPPTYHFPTCRLVWHCNGHLSLSLSLHFFSFYFLLFCSFFQLS
ncbi:hypothetical protein NMG60_11036745 [Bertholletia excelsa]